MRTTKSDEELVQKVLAGSKKVSDAFAKWRKTKADKIARGESVEELYPASVEDQDEFRR